MLCYVFDKYYSRNFTFVKFSDIHSILEEGTFHYLFFSHLLGSPQF